MASHLMVSTIHQHGTVFNGDTDFLAESELDSISNLVNMLYFEGNRSLTCWKRDIEVLIGQISLCQPPCHHGAASTRDCHAKIGAVGGRHSSLWWWGWSLCAILYPAGATSALYYRQRPLWILSPEQAWLYTFIFSGNFLQHSFDAFCRVQILLLLILFMPKKTLAQIKNTDNVSPY